MDGGQTAPPRDAARSPGAPTRLRRLGEAANRLASSKVARTVITLAILAIAAFLIRGELQSARFTDVTHAIAATPLWALGACVAFTALTYACEGVVEWYTLRFIGKPQPLGRTLAAAAGSSALSIAMGFGLASGTASRLRFYAFAGLQAADVAKITGLVSAAIFLSGLVALGLSGFGALGVIGTILHWPAPGVAALSVLLLAGAPVWFLVLNRWPGHRGTAPGPLGRAGALAAGLGDWLFQGAAMFILASQDPAGFPGFFAAFLLASLVGSAIGVPADLGVLEATVIGSHSLGSAQQAAAALVLYRVIFQLVPLILATTAMMLRPMAGAARKVAG